jgi:Lrp/AsnC family leucine-responsive transcriptional regulator
MKIEVDDLSRPAIHELLREHLRNMHELGPPESVHALDLDALRRPEILECHLVAGGFDYLIKTRVADMQAYREFVGSVIWALPGVRETRTYAVMEEVKNTTMLPIR